LFECCDWNHYWHVPRQLCHFRPLHFQQLHETSLEERNDIDSPLTFCDDREALERLSATLSEDLTSLSSFAGHLLAKGCLSDGNDS